MADQISSFDQVRVAILGFGFMGRTHFGSFSRSAGCSVAAVLDRDPNRLKAGDEGSGNLKTAGSDADLDLAGVFSCESIDSLLGECDFDLGVITTPTPTHCEIASRLVKAGKHVLIEKPVALDVGSISLLDAEVRRRDVLAMPAHCMRFWPAWVRMREAIRSEEYGKVHRAIFTRTGARPSWNSEFYLDFEKSGGAIEDLHIHDTDFIIHCFGMPTAVSSSGSRAFVKTVYHFESGPKVEAIGGWLDNPESEFTMTAEIECDLGTISFDFSREPSLLLRRTGGGTVDLTDGCDEPSAYDEQASCLIEAIRSGSRAAPVTLQDALHAAHVVKAEIQSTLDGGCRVKIRD